MLLTIKLPDISYFWKFKLFHTGYCYPAPKELFFQLMQFMKFLSAFDYVLDRVSKN
jgi:hypothetical protein